VIVLLLPSNSISFLLGYTQPLAKLVGVLRTAN